MWCSAVRQCWRALREEAALPESDLWPMERPAFLRFGDRYGRASTPGAMRNWWMCWLRQTFRYQSDAIGQQ
jgi:hypothetical protein